MKMSACLIGLACAMVAFGASAADKDLYGDLVAPIIKAKCADCHSPEKKKGRLVVTTYADLMKGGENGKAITAGDPSGSRMIKMIMLPKGDDDHMPPAKKPQLTAAEISALRWWIGKGAPEKMKISEAGAIPDDVKPLIDAAK